jgi:hypothetical protein
MRDKALAIWYTYQRSLGLIHKKVDPLKIWVVLANRQRVQIAVNH